METLVALCSTRKALQNAQTPPGSTGVTRPQLIPTGPHTQHNHAINLAHTYTLTQVETRSVKAEKDMECTAGAKQRRKMRAPTARREGGARGPMTEKM